MSSPSTRALGEASKFQLDAGTCRRRARHSPTFVVFTSTSQAFLHIYIRWIRSAMPTGIRALSTDLADSRRFSQTAPSSDGILDPCAYIFYEDSCDSHKTIRGKQTFFGQCLRCSRERQTEVCRTQLPKLSKFLPLAKPQRHGSVRIVLTGEYAEVPFAL